MKITEDLEAMDALRYLRRKGYTPKHIVESYRQMFDPDLVLPHVVTKITVENTEKHPGETFTAEPLRTENSWRVRRSFDGQNVMFRVSRDDAENFAAAMNAKVP